MNIIEYELNENCLIADVNGHAMIKKVFIPKGAVLSIEFNGKRRLFINMIREGEYLSFDGKNDAETEQAINDFQKWIED